MDTLEPTQAPERTEQQQQQPEVDAATGKYIYSYQPVDTDNNPIGRPYRFLYTDHMDLVKQLTEAKANGDRFIHEVKTGKRKLERELAQEQPDFKAAPYKDEFDQQVREDWRKNAEAEFGVPLDSVKERLKKARDLEQYLLCQSWAINKEADGYYICPENGKTIAKYMADNNLAYTQANLDSAFEDLQDTLVSKPKEATVITTPADSSGNGSSQTGTPPAKQPQTASGFEPGQFQGARPGTQEQKPLSAERFRQINKMSRDEFNRLKRTNQREYDAFVAMKTPKVNQA